MPDLERFLDAQAGTYEHALAELQAGRKRSHWMWFIFPQLAGLGRSETARYYALHSLDDARPWLAHPVLGPRLEACCHALLGSDETGEAEGENRGRSAREILGSPDDLKLRSSMTLFAEAATDPALYRRVLARYFGGRADERTLELLASQ